LEEVNIAEKMTGKVEQRTFLVLKNLILPEMKDQFNLKKQKKNDSTLFRIIQ